MYKRQRLDYATAVKQFVFVAVSVTVSLVVPVIIRRLKFLSKWTNFYAGVGIAALLFVAVLGQTSYGAKLGFSIGGISIQPSESVSYTHLDVYKRQDQICVHQRAISKNGESIICLPNKVVVSIEGAEDSQIDVVAR